MERCKKGLRRLLALGLWWALLLPAAAVAAEPAELPPDVSDGAWYAPYVQVCLEKGLMDVLEDGSFAPDREVTVAELIVLTAQLWMRDKTDMSAMEELDEVWYTAEEPPSMSRAFPFTYSDAILYVSEKDNGFLLNIQDRLEELGQPVTEVPATRGDLCSVWGGNMSSPVYHRRTSEEWEKAGDLMEENRGAYTLYMTGIMEGTENGFALDKTLPRREAAAFLARYICPELRLPGEEPCPYSQEELAQVYLGFGSFGETFLEYKLDLDSGKLWQWELTDEEEKSGDRSAGMIRPRKKGREADAENEGYSLCAELSQTQMEELRDSGVLEKALTWKHRYEAAYAFDGLQWNFTFTFRNGGTWEVSGSNVTPEGWKALYEAICTLAGRGA